MLIFVPVEMIKKLVERSSFYWIYIIKASWIGNLKNLFKTFTVLKKCQ